MSRLASNQSKRGERTATIGFEMNFKIWNSTVFNALTIYPWLEYLNRKVQIYLNDNNIRSRASYAEKRDFRKQEWKEQLTVVQTYRINVIVCVL